MNSKGTTQFFGGIEYGFKTGTKPSEIAMVATAGVPARFSATVLRIC